MRLPGITYNLFVLCLSMALVPGQRAFGQSPANLQAELHALELEGRYSQAQEKLAIAHRSNPQDLWMGEHLARLMILTGDYHGTAELLAQLVPQAESETHKARLTYLLYVTRIKNSVHDPSLVETIRHEVQNRIINDTAADVDYYVYAGLSSMRQQYIAAKSHYERGLAKFPNSGLLYRGLAQTQGFLGERIRELAAYHRMEALDPTIKGHLTHKGLAYWLEFQKDKAWQAIDGFFQSVDNIPMVEDFAIHALAVLLLRDDPGQAEKDLAVLTRLAPGHQQTQLVSQALEEYRKKKAAGQTMGHETQTTYANKLANLLGKGGLQLKQTSQEQHGT